MLPDYIVKNIILVIIACVLIISLALFLQYKLDIKVEKFIGNILPVNKPDNSQINRQIQIEKQSQLASRKNEIDATFDIISKKIQQKKDASLLDNANKSLALEFKKRFNQMEYENDFDQFYKTRILQKMHRHGLTYKKLMQMKKKPTPKKSVKKYVAYNMPQEIPIRYKVENDKMVLVDGYFKKSDTTMAKIPLGYKRDPLNEYKLIPLDNAVKGPSIFDKPLVGEIPKENQKMKEGYYKISDKEMGLLPPGKLPNITKLEIDTSKMPHRLLYYYGNGFVNEKEYYKKEYDIIGKPRFLPTGVYFTDANRNKISVLPYGKVADTQRGYGIRSSDDLISKTGRFDEVRLSDGKLLNPKGNVNLFNASTKKLNNYNVEFHEKAEISLKKQEADKQGPMVIGPDGKMIQLPKVKVQGSPLYYKAGQYPYGKSYVPSYEDSIYATKSIKLPTEIYEKVK